MNDNVELLSVQSAPEMVASFVCVLSRSAKLLEEFPNLFSKFPGISLRSISVPRCNCACCGPFTAWLRGSLVSRHGPRHINKGIAYHPSFRNRKNSSSFLISSSFLVHRGKVHRQVESILRFFIPAVWRKSLTKHCYCFQKVNNSGADMKAPIASPVETAQF